MEFAIGLVLFVGAAAVWRIYRHPPQWWPANKRRTPTREQRRNAPTLHRVI